MKLKTNTSNFLFTACLLSTSLFFASCQDDDGEKNTPVIDNTKKKEHVDKILAFREELDFINRFVNKNVMGDVAEEGLRMFTPKSFGRVKEVSPCTDVTEEELPDGSIKINLNFGDGCETEEGVEVAGAVEMIFKLDESTFTYDIEFIDYKEGQGGQRPGELVNGTVKGDFTFDLMSGLYSQSMDQDLEITYFDKTTAYYRATQEAAMTEAGLRVTAFTTGGVLATGDNFKTTLQKDVVYDFNCAGNLPTTGEEKLTFMGSTIVVNYGDGACDKVYSVD
jgi:hypothetical protein